MSDRYNMPLIIIVGCLLIFAFYYFFKKNSVVKNNGTLNVKVDSSSMNQSSEDDNSSYTPDYNSNSSDDDDDSMVRIGRRGQGGLDRDYFEQQGALPRENSYRAKKQDLSNVEPGAYEIDDMTRDDNKQYTPIDESDGNNRLNTQVNNKLERNDKYGNINGRVDFDNYKGTSTEKHDSNQLLPQEKEADWFQTIETTNVKNSNLINIYRPIGVNTISSSHKLASYDLRGTVPCPKFNVAPWNQSSVAQDNSLKSLC